MKKIMIAAVAVSLMSVSVFGATGTITKIRYKAGENPTITLTADDNSESIQRLVGSTDDVKAMVAIALTAKSANAANVVLGSGTDGVSSGWVSISF